VETFFTGRERNSNESNETNVLNGTVAAKGKTVFRGTVVRLVVQTRPNRLLTITSSVVIGSGFPETLNSTALVIGPTGAGLSANDGLAVKPGADAVYYVDDATNTLDLLH
jgi:hypothetical protein